MPERRFVNVNIGECGAGSVAIGHIAELGAVALACRVVRARNLTKTENNRASVVKVSRGKEFRSRVECEDISRARAGKTSIRLQVVPYSKLRATMQLSKLHWQNYRVI